MADPKVKTVKYYREYLVQKRTGQVQFYDDIDTAVNDPNPQLDKFVFQANVKLLGEIKLALVPVEDPNQAVKAILTLSEPVESSKPKKK